MTVSQIVLVGDSITYGGIVVGVGTSSLIKDGGLGAWAELDAEGLANVSGIGPLISSGFRSTWIDEWGVTSGTWGAVISTDAFDRVPYGEGLKSAGGSSNILKWTRPTQWRPVVGFALYFVDRTTGGNWSYRVDGGAWTAMGQTLAQDNLLAKFYVPTAVAVSVEVRAANVAGTAVAVCVAGIEAFFLSPLTTTAGLIVHNIARNGAPLNTLTLATSGDRMAFFDAVKVDPVNGGGAITNRPNVAITMMHVNDVRLFADVPTWAADIATFYARVNALAPLGYLSYGEMQAPTYNATTQANYRAQTKTSAALHSIPVLDLFDAWGGAVGTQNAALAAAGIITISASPADNGHPTQTGNFDMAHRIIWWLRTQFFASTINQPSSMTVNAKQAAVAYSGKQAAVAYSARAPVSV